MAAVPSFGLLGASIFDVSMLSYEAPAASTDDSLFILSSDDPRVRPSPCG